MKKSLIVFHSRDGNTRRVAQALAKRLDAALDEIRIVQPLEGPLGYLMCAIESIAALTPALRPSHHDPAGYDLVVVGTPVWFWNVSSPVRSWLEAHPPRRRVAFFCTMGGSGSTRAFATMAALAGRKPVATLALLQGDVDADRFEGRLDAFARQLAASAPARARRAPARDRVPAPA